MAACTALALGTFMMTSLGHAYRGRVQVALVLDLMAPIVAWFVLKAIGRSRTRKAALAGTGR